MNINNQYTQGKHRKKAKKLTITSETITRRGNNYLEAEINETLDFFRNRLIFVPFCLVTSPNFLP